MASKLPVSTLSAQRQRMRTGSSSTPQDPVFVLGTGRSGTTITARCLGEHPELLFIDEPRFITEVLLKVLHDQLAVPQALAALKISDDGSGKEPMKLLRRLREHYGARLDKESLERIGCLVIEVCSGYLAAAPKLTTTARYKRLREVVGQIVAETLRHLQGSRWLVKEPVASLALEDLLLTFPDSHFVHVMRHPGDVLNSRLEQGFQRDFDSAFEVWHQRALAVARFAHHHRERMHTVQLEDIVEAPEQMLAQILEFLQLPPCHFLAEAVSAQCAHVGRSMGRFTAQQVGRLKAACAQVDAAAGSENFLPPHYFEFS